MPTITTLSRAAIAIFWLAALVLPAQAQTRGGTNTEIASEQLTDGWKVAPIPAGVFGVNAADREWVDRQCTPQSLACFQQPVELTGQLAQIRRIDYVFASGWGGGHSPFIPFYEKARTRGWHTHELACGHDVMIDEPAALTSLLVAAIHA